MKKQRNLEEICYLVNKDGEVIKEVSNPDNYVEMYEGDRLLRKSSLESFDKRVEIKMRFAKVNYVVFSDICNKYSIFCKLIPYIGYNTGKLRYRNGNKIRRKDLAKICGVSSITIDRQLKGLMRDDVIKSVKDNDGLNYYVNPYVVHLGKKINSFTYNLFKDTIYRTEYEAML